MINLLSYFILPPSLAHLSFYSTHLSRNYFYLLNSIFIYFALSLFLYFIYIFHLIALLTLLLNYLYLFCFILFAL